jgi:hypothetical protein
MVTGPKKRGVLLVTWQRLTTLALLSSANNRPVLIMLMSARPTLSLRIPLW